MDDFQPITRVETYLAALSGEDVTPPEPTTRIEEWLDKVVDNVDNVQTEKVTTAVDAWLSDHVDPDTGYVLDDTMTLDNAAAPAGTVGEKLTALENGVVAVDAKINSLIVNAPDLTQYFYKANIYINNSGVETAVTGWDTYKIPCEEGQIVHISWPELASTPWIGLQDVYAIKLFDKNADFVVVGAATTDSYLYTPNKECMIVPPQDSAYVTITVKRGNESAVAVHINGPVKSVDAPANVDYTKTAYVITEETAIRTQFYFNYSNGTLAALGAVVKALWLQVKQGDRLTFSTLRSGVSFRGEFRTPDGTATAIGTGAGSAFSYTAPSDGILLTIYLANETGDTLIEPKDQIKLSSDHIIGLENGQQFNGLSGVAFGTSLTYRKATGNGYLIQLEPLSGIEFDNQGVGSSTILGDGGSLDMLAHIKAYSSYGSKKVCLLEGFVNDWYYNKTLGTWDDEGETTVCGCVRSALNFILSQNANLSVFLILDHYGQLYSSLDCSSTATNAGGLTQYQYYEEIAKVANSLGIPVIKEYEISQISENAPQFLADNIHCNVLGATQSGNAIWSQMRQHYPLVES